MHWQVIGVEPTKVHFKQNNENNAWSVHCLTTIVWQTQTKCGRTGLNITWVAISSL